MTKLRLAVSLRRGRTLLGIFGAAALALAGFFYASLQAEQPIPTDPVLLAIKDLTKELIYVGTVPYSPGKSLGEHGELPKPLGEFPPARGQAYILETPRSVNRITHGDLLAQLTKHRVTASPVGHLVYAMTGGPFYVIEFSYDGHHGNIFNAPNAAIAADEQLKSKWYDEDIGIVYDK